jgi:hypothetical protein
MQEVCKILWTDVQLPLPWAIKAVSSWFTRHMKMSRYTMACNTDSKFKKLLFDADADAANAAAENKPKNKKNSKSSAKKKSSAKSSVDVSKKEIVYGHSSAAERTKFHKSSQVITSPRVSTVSPRVSSVLTSPGGVSQEHGTITTGISFIAGDHVIIGPDQTTMYARASVGTLSILFSIVFIVLTDYCLRR